MNPKELLTIGLAVFRDDCGAYFTLQSLHAHHPHVQYLVIDNAPESCKRTRDVTNAVGGRYIHRPDLHGTSAPRDAIFRLAKTPWAMCLDSHVLLETGAVQCLLDYIEANPDSNSMIQSPMVYDDGKLVSTHWRRDDSTGGVGLWGTWDTDKRGMKAYQCKKCIVSMKANESDFAVGGLFTDRRCDECRTLLTWAEPFEILMQGLGLFAMRCKAWPGFHPLWRGFGGEEGQIHEKVRQRGGKCLCLPGLRWRHRFRQMEHGAPAPPYKLDRADHCFNLLVGHRELGIDAVEPIRKTFGNVANFEQLKAESERVQAWNMPSDRRRLSLLGVWYTNNSAPEPLLQKSLQTIKRAVDETMHHDVQICTSVWHQIPGNPFPCDYNLTALAGVPDGHAKIIAQVRRCVALAGSFEYDAVVFLEHDVLYPPQHFDKIGDAFNSVPNPYHTTLAPPYHRIENKLENYKVLMSIAPVVSNLDYIGLNATGWLGVKERHEPLHELSMRRDVFLANMNRVEADCKKPELQGAVLLEPQGDRNDWVRIPPQGLAPAVHVNWI